MFVFAGNRILRVAGHCLSEPPPTHTPAQSVTLYRSGHHFAMGPKKAARTGSTTTDDTADAQIQDSLALRLVELLNDDQVIAKLRQSLFPKELATTIDQLNDRIRRLNEKLDLKDEHIKSLEDRIVTLEHENDNVEQYSRRANLRVCGIPEANAGEDTDTIVLAVFNDKLGMEPPLQPSDLERSHRLGRKADDGQGPSRTRPIIVRFGSERVRDTVYRARTRLKGHDIYINEDLTARRAKLTYDVRQLKRGKKILDCWTSYGKVVVKDTTGRIKEIKTPSDLLKF